MDTQIAMLWMRGRLSFLERLCVQSFLDAGHHVVLYSYDPVDAVPEAVERRDANEVMPERGFLVNTMTGSPALHSDLFRYKLLRENDRTIWADTDAYCLRRFQTFDGHLHGWESPRDINGGVLSLPPDSASLNALLEFTADEYAIPPWHATRYEGRRGKPIRKAIETGEKVHVADQPWGVWGPHAVTYFLMTSGDVRYTRPQVVLYPYSYKSRREMLKPIGSLGDSAITEETKSVHFFGRRMRRRVAQDNGGFPDPYSLLGRLLIKHRVDPAEFPMAECPELNPDHPAAKTYRDAARGGALHPVSTVTEPDSIRPLTKVTAVTTMRNEGPYILDWVSYHLGVGITHFLVYTNDCDDQTVEILDRLSELGIVTREDNPFQPGERPQRAALAAAETRPAVTEADAYIVMDVDEYMNIHVGEGRLQDLFKACGDPDLISMTWRFFGCDSVLAFEDQPVPAQFTRAAPLDTRTPHQNWGFKTIVRRDAAFDRIGVHRPLEPTGPMPKWVNGSGRQMPDGYRDSGWRSNRRSWGYDLVALNHYAIRSIDGFLVKRDRGRTNHINRDQGVAYWNTHNRNDEVDRSILDRLSLMKPARERFAQDPVLSRLHTDACAWHVRRAAALRSKPDFGLLFDAVSRMPLSYQVEEVELADANARAYSDLASEHATRSEPKLPQNPPLSTGGDPIYVGENNEIAFRALLDRVEPRYPRLNIGPNLPDNRIVLVTSMKNEGVFLLEWIAYHLSIGVDHFLVYTNDCDDPTNALLDRLEELGYVTRRDNPFDRSAGQKPQRGALNAAWKEPIVKDADWVGVIDVDEFVNVHVGDGTLKTLFRLMNYPNVISMTWRLFGNRDIASYRDEWITEQFTRAAPLYLPRPRLGWGFKSFVHRSAPYGKLGVHRPLDIDLSRFDELRWVNGSGRVMPEKSIRSNTWFSRKASVGYEMVTLNHYVLRSAESFLVKRQRGRINHVDQDQGFTYWKNRNYATERDVSILRHLPRARDTYKTIMADPEIARLHHAAVAWHKDRIATLMQDNDYRALFEAISSPDIPDAIYVAEISSEAEGGEIEKPAVPQHAAE